MTPEEIDELHQKVNRMKNEGKSPLNKMRKFRIWWGPHGFSSGVYEAETAEDALVIAKIDFERLGHKVYKMEALNSNYLEEPPGR